MANFNSQDGRSVNGLTRQHFAGIAFVIVQALEAYDEKHRDDEPGTGDIASLFVERCLLPEFVRMFKSSNGGFKPERFQAAYEGELGLAMSRMLGSYGLTPAEVDAVDGLANDMATTLCEAVETSTGKTIDQSIKDGTLPDDVAQAGKEWKDRSGETSEG